MQEWAAGIHLEAMSKVVFTTKIGSSYDDRPEEHYHFPRTYLAQARSAVGDHIIYYEPRRLSLEDSSRGGRQAYFATGRVEEIVEGRSRPDHFYATISGYLSFDRPVPFIEGSVYYESALRKEDGSTNRGAFGRAVRVIPEIEFDGILKAGFATELQQAADGQHRHAGGFEAPIQSFERPIVELTISKPFRERAFMRAVREAYGNRCAFTGLRLINGGGRPEVQAAHIRSVAEKGPDSIRNGLALSGTLHWLFDRGLLSVDDGHQILVAQAHVPDQIRGLLNSNGKILAPKDESDWPHPYYLKYHREHKFKG
jgi:putative restriction endonuclease